MLKRIINSVADWQQLTQLVTDRLDKKPTPFMVELKEPPKTHEQLGYFHATVLPRLTEALHSVGEIRNKSEREGKYWLKRHINYGLWIEFGSGRVFDPDSFEAATVEVLSNAIDVAIEETEVRGVPVPPPTTRRKE